MPGAVRIGRAQDFLRTFQLLGHLDEPDRLTAASIETAPVGLSRCNSTLGELIGFVRQTGVSDPEGPVPVVRHAVVSEAVHMVDSSQWLLALKKKSRVSCRPKSVLFPKLLK